MINMPLRKGGGISVPKRVDALKNIFYSDLHVFRPITKIYLPKQINAIKKNLQNYLKYFDVYELLKSKQNLSIKEQNVKTNIEYFFKKKNINYEATYNSIIKNHKIDELIKNYKQKNTLTTEFALKFVEIIKGYKKNKDILTLHTLDKAFISLLKVNKTINSFKTDLFLESNKAVNENIFNKNIKNNNLELSDIFYMNSGLKENLLSNIILDKSTLYSEQVLGLYLSFEKINTEVLLINEKLQNYVNGINSILKQIDVVNKDYNTLFLKDLNFHLIKDKLLLKIDKYENYTDFKKAFFNIIKQKEKELSKLYNKIEEISYKKYDLYVHNKMPLPKTVITHIKNIYFGKTVPDSQHMGITTIDTLKNNLNKIEKNKMKIIKDLKTEMEYEEDLKSKNYDLAILKKRGVITGASERYVNIKKDIEILNSFKTELSKFENRLNTLDNYAQLDYFKKTYDNFCNIFKSYYRFELGYTTYAAEINYEAINHQVESLHNLWLKQQRMLFKINEIFNKKFITPNPLFLEDLKLSDANFVLRFETIFSKTYETYISQKDNEIKQEIRNHLKKAINDYVKNAKTLSDKKIWLRKLENKFNLII